MKEEGARRRRGSGTDERTGGGAREWVVGGGLGNGFSILSYCPLILFVAT